MTLDKIRKKHRLSFILIHGSQVSGKTHAKSDIDIAVMQKKAGGELDSLELYKDFGKTFKTDKIDIVDLKRANPLLMFTIARKSRLLSGSERDYKAFLRLAFHKYADYQPYFKKEADFVKERLSSYAQS